jgi:DNA-binding transcriptional LysR family regulator
MLEKQLGVELFERGGRGVRLTARGQQFYGYAQQILDLVEEACQQVGNVQPPLAGPLRIASSSVPSEWLLPELLAEFRVRCPQIRESIVVSDSPLAAAAVESGEADVGFVGELPRSSTLEARPVADDELELFVAADHRWSGKRSVTIDQLRGEPLIVREPGSASRACVERALDEQGLSAADFSVAMEVNSNDAIRAAVQRGVGVAFLSKRANRQQAGLVPIKVRGLRPQRKLYVIRNPRRNLPTTARQFLEFIDQWRTAHTVGIK